MQTTSECTHIRRASSETVHACWCKHVIVTHVRTHTQTHTNTLTCQSSGGKNTHLRHGSARKHFILITLLFSLSHTLCISVFRHHHSHLFPYFFLMRGLSLPPSLLNLISLSPFSLPQSFPPSRCLSCETFNRRGNGFISGTEIK